MERGAFVTAAKLSPWKGRERIEQKGILALRVTMRLEAFLILFIKIPFSYSSNPILAWPLEKSMPEVLQKVKASGGKLLCRLRCSDCFLESGSDIEFLSSSACLEAPRRLSSPGKRSLVSPERFLPD